MPGLRAVSLSQCNVNPFKGEKYLNTLQKSDFLNDICKFLSIKVTWYYTCGKWHGEEKAISRCKGVIGSEGLHRLA